MGDPTSQELLPHDGLSPRPIVNDERNPFYRKNFAAARIEVNGTFLNERAGKWADGCAL